MLHVLQQWLHQRLTSSAVANTPTAPSIRIPSGGGNPTASPPLRCLLPQQDLSSLMPALRTLLSIHRQCPQHVATRLPNHGTVLVSHDATATVSSCNLNYPLTLHPAAQRKCEHMTPCSGCKGLFSAVPYWQSRTACKRINQVESKAGDNLPWLNVGSVI
jgi:hypothetical protein